jgi:hypothetical protein
MLRIYQGHGQIADSLDLVTNVIVVVFNDIIEGFHQCTDDFIIIDSASQKQFVHDKTFLFGYLEVAAEDWG